MTLLETAFEALITSYYHTQRHRQIGERRQVGPLAHVHYEFEVDQEQQVADYFFARQAAPAEAIALIREVGPAENHQILVLAQEEGVQAEYAEQGCLLLAENLLMARRPGPVPDLPALWPVKQADRPGDILFLNLMEGAGGIQMSDLQDPLLRFYYVLDEGVPVGQARNGRLSNSISWVANVQTVPAYRGCGVGQALMARILRDTVAAGVASSMLLSTPAGLRLYQKLGYEQVAPVAVFRLGD